MFLESSGISKVRSFALPCGITGTGRVSAANAAVVRWQSLHNDRLYQVYVNGRFAAATVEPSQRTAVVPIPLSTQTAVRIQVFAVESRYAHIDFSHLVEQSRSQTARVEVSFPRTMDLSLDSRVDYYLQDERLNGEQIKIYRSITDKSGFGLGGFGSGDFGYEGSSSPGFGKGGFGTGQFGFDAYSVCWRSRQLQAGRYQFRVQIRNDKGNTAPVIETQQLILLPPAQPARGLKIKSFDKQNKKLVLKVE